MTIYTPSLISANTEQMALGTIRSGWPVAAVPLKATQETVNWLFGRGVPLAIDGCKDWYFGSGAQTAILNYRFYRDNAHTMTAVFITMSTVLGPSSTTVEVVDSFQFEVTATPQTFAFAIPNITGNLETSVALKFEWDSTIFSRLFIHNVYIIEAPQHVLPNGGLEPINQREMVYDGSASARSIVALEDEVENLRSNYFRRGALYNWTAGNADGVETTSTSYEDLHPHGIRPAIQQRLMASGETFRAAKVNVFARVTGGTGNVRVTMTNGDSVTFNVTSTTDTWHTTADIDVSTDDPTRWDTDGGIRGGARDEVTIEYRAGAGQTIHLLGVSIWDAPGA